MSPDNDLEREILQLEQRYAENAHGLVFAHLADAYRRAGEYSKAEGLLVHGLKSHPSYTSAYNVLGRVYIDSERYEDAHAQFARVLELDPHNLISLRALGDLAARRGHTADAREWYERMLQIDPRSEEARDGLAKLTGQPEEPPTPEPAVDEEPMVSSEPEGIGAAGPDERFDAASEPAPVAEDSWGSDSWGSDQGPTAEAEDRGLETVEKTQAEFEPVEGLMGAAGMDGVSLDDRAEVGEPETMPVSEEQDIEPWMVDEPYVAPEVPEDTADRVAGQEPEGDEPWLFAEGEPTDEESYGPKEEAAVEEEAEPWLTAETESLELPSMDDWSPGFVVGELLEGQAAEELRPEEILEGLDAEYTFEAAEEATDQADWSGPVEDERATDGVVTETMAELYASQGLYSDALSVYQRLAEANPDDERLRSRIVELERRIEEVAGPVPDEDELVRLMRLTQPDEEEPPGMAAVEETAAEIESEVFGFEDEAQVAGFEQLDPFAASFDTLAAKAQEPESLLEEASQEESAAAEQEPEPGEPPEAEPVPVEWLAEESAAEESPGPIEAAEAELAILGQAIGESPADVGAEEESTELDSEDTEYAPADEGITAVDSIWELTEVGASEVRQAADQVDETEEESEEVDVPVRIDGGAGVTKPEQPSTIEDYVNALLSFDVESLFGASLSPGGSQEDEPRRRPESSRSEDLEQFQEWLKSLKR